jgi:predicted dehydrogenase
MGMIVEAMRYRPQQPHRFESYRKIYKRLPESIEATGEDSIIALYRMKSGAMVQFSSVTGGRGERSFERSIHGPLGSLDLPGDRNGGQVVFRQGDKQLRSRELLSLLPNFQLNEITERLFGKKSVEYTLPFTEIDAKTLAIEFHDFGEAIITGRQPEVGGHLGMTAVSGILGVFESAILNRSVSLDEILSGTAQTYQAEIDAELRLGDKADPLA